MVHHGGKYLVKNDLGSYSEIAIEALGKVCNHYLALNFNENGNTLNRKASLETPLSFNISHAFRKVLNEHSDPRLTIHEKNMIVEPFE